MIYVGNYLSTPPAAFCSSPVSQAKQLSAELCCRPLTSISRDCSNCCTLRCCSRICRPLIRNVGAAAVMNYLSFWSLRDECVCELLTVSRTIEVFVSWHQEILICKYLRSSCCTFPHIITLSSQQSTFKHFCHPPLSAPAWLRLRYLLRSRGQVMTSQQFYQNLQICSRCVWPQTQSVRKVKYLNLLYDLVHTAQPQFFGKVPSYLEDPFQDWSPGRLIIAKIHLTSHSWLWWPRHFLRIVMTQVLSYGLLSVPLESLIIVCQTLTGGDNTDNHDTSNRVKSYQQS